MPPFAVKHMSFNTSAKHKIENRGSSVLSALSTHRGVHPIVVTEDEVYRNGRVQLWQAMHKRRVRPRSRLQDMAERALAAPVSGR